jgi:hypothetical protein
MTPIPYISSGGGSTSMGFTKVDSGGRDQPQVRLDISTPVKVYRDVSTPTKGRG